MGGVEIKQPRRTRFGRTRRSSSDSRAYRLATSIRVPWMVGVSALLLLAMAAALLLGRSTGSVTVPRAVVDDQAALTQQAAQSARRSLNEGVDDLTEAAAFVGGQGGVTAGVPDLATLRSALQALAAAHNRYLSVYVLGTDGAVLASLGEPPRPELLQSGPPFAQPGMEARVLEGGQPAILQFAPIPGSAGGGLALVGVYDPAFLQFPLEGFAPGNAWMVDERGRVVAAIPPGTSPGSLPGENVEEAEARGRAGDVGASVVGTEPANQVVLGFAPVTGAGPAGATRWTVLSSRQVSELPLPQLDARRQGLVFGLLLFGLTLLVFSWLYVVLIAPVLAVQKEAERLAFGDLSESVRVVRYDEIGLIARALERIRIALIQKRVQPRPRKER